MLCMEPRPKCQPVGAHSRLHKSLYFPIYSSVTDADKDDTADDNDAQEEESRTARNQSRLDGSRTRSGSVLPSFQVGITKP